ncbi:peptide/nickel transport system permease protein [Lipingzhangella halophila]|uniref:Peptide/nickel transport system permease protein n=1 Tax=Lipingzhangella halophila TaxID=1783352 RepID=A0A7W7RH72_9ACTN|nr:ABC transporter permease subunit [Lipingzhangella halophila]MBB4931568.1 peptide/nickel transport system permease protein [Lipingzhangella halophila]
MTPVAGDDGPRRAGRWLAPLRGPLTALAWCTGIAFLVGALPWLSGDDPARTVLRARSAERVADPEALRSVRDELDLPTDPVSGTLGWLGGAVRGDLGVSWVTGAPVAPDIANALGVSVSLASFAALVALSTGILVVLPGLLRAARAGHPGGRGADVTGALLASVPDFLLASVFLAIAAVRWDLAPTSGWETPAHAVLPALALGLPAGGLVSRVLSSALGAALAESWIRTWRATGFAPRTIAAALLRRTLAVAMPQVMLVFAGLLGSAVLVESVFAIPGLGHTALVGTLAQDLPVVQGAVAALVLVGLLAGGIGVAVHRALLGPALVSSGLTPAVPIVPAARRLPLAVGGVLLLGVVVGLTRDPEAISLTARLEPPSAAHPLGTDPLGRDLLARFGHGALLSAGAGVAVSLVALVAGGVIGVSGRRARAGAADVLNALPPVLVGVLLAAVTGPGLAGAATAVALVAWIPIAVHARTLAAEVRASGYHQAAVAGGATRGWILRRHLLPSVLPAVARHALMRVPHNTLALVGLSFLGLGAPHDSPEWGAMLAESMRYVERAPWAVAVPALGLALLGVVASLLRTERR